MTRWHARASQGQRSQAPSRPDRSLRTALVAVVIPAWNEPESITSVLSELPSDTARWVFVVVRDAQDPTADVARALGAIPLVQSYPGYGEACLEGAMTAIAHGADVLVFLDGDHSDPPAELPRLLRPVLDDEADLVLGVRDLVQHPSAIPAHARLGNHLVRLLIALLVRRSFRDLPSFKVIRAETFARLAMRERTYGWTVEFLVKAARARLRITEVPVPYRPRLAGRSKVSGTVRGTIGAASKLLASTVRYSTWTPSPDLGMGTLGPNS